MEKSLTTRVTEILTKPKDAWTEIAGESFNLQDLYQSYVIPLAAIPAVAGFIGQAFVGMPIIGRMPIVTALASAIVSFVLALAMVYIVAHVINWLAPRFGGQANFGQAFKVAAYAYTAAWVAGIVAIIPSLGIIALLGGLYSLYLLYLGIEALMKPAADKALIYTVAVVGIVIVISIVLMIVISPIIGMGMVR